MEKHGPISAFEELPLSVVGKGTKATTKWYGFTSHQVSFQSWRLGAAVSPSSFSKVNSTQLPEGLEMQPPSQCVHLQ